MKFEKTLAALELANSFLDKIGYNSEEFKQSIRESMKEIQKAKEFSCKCEKLSEEFETNLKQAFINGYKMRAEASDLNFDEKRELHANILYSSWKTSN
jgi:(p)ppGpp synthase/HD superfamily hydrolase